MAVFRTLIAFKEEGSSHSKLLFTENAPTLQSFPNGSNLETILHSSPPTPSLHVPSLSFLNLLYNDVPNFKLKNFLNLQLKINLQEQLMLLLLFLK